MTNLVGAPVNNWVKFEVAPPTTSDTKLPPNYNWLYYTNAGTIAAQTFTLPDNPVDGQMVMVSNTSIITALTLSPTVLGAPAGLTAGQGIRLAYSAPQASWFVASL